MAAQKASVAKAGAAKGAGKGGARSLDKTYAAAAKAGAASGGSSSGKAAVSSLQKQVEELKAKLRKAQEPHVDNDAGMGDACDTEQDELSV